VGTISPAGVTGYQEEDARNVFQGGNAAFMRNWPYVYAAANQPDSPMRGNFDAAALPNDGTNPSAGTIGGWQLAVSNYSQNPEAAVEFVRYMTSPEVLKYRALVGSYIPTHEAVQADTEVIAALPFLELLANREVELVTRPSTVTGETYNEASTAIFQGVAQILQGQDATQVPPTVEQRIQRTLPR
jgi:trehalose/maltose transport system substrate-binding protein